MKNKNNPLEILTSSYKWLEKIPSLRKWRLAYFKSVKHRIEVDLAPLTVVAGANSSGKSTLIQSILFMAQNAMRTEEISPTKMQGKFELNGPLVQLGTFKETACDLDGYTGAKRWLEFGGLWTSGAFEQFLEWDLRLKPANFSNLDSGIGHVLDSRVQSFAKGKLGDTEIAQGGLIGVNTEFLNSKFEKFSFNHFMYSVDPESSDHVRNKRNKKSAVSFQSGLPTSGLIRKNIVKYMIDNQSWLLRDELMGGGYGSYDPEGELSNDERFNTLDEVIEALVLILAEYGRKILQQDRVTEDRDVSALTHAIESNFLIPYQRFPESSPNFDPVFMIIEEEQSKAISRIEKFTDGFMRKLSFRLKELHGESEWARESTFCTPEGKRSTEPVYGLQFSTSYNVIAWNKYLSEKVRYLGPLRVGPRATYGIGASTENFNLPLGESGEFLAKKLFNDKTSRLYPIVEKGKLRDAFFTLEEAVTFWYRELCATGEINEIGVGAPNRQGYPLTIGNRTLANVGFGASQILPVLGLCLSSSPGDLILLEQPELHLNPGMQQKLADFLLLMSKTGRQIIVETHSEYLITRLRRNAASDPDDHKYFTIIFVERDEKEGTSYRSVNVNEMGDLSEWPKGFFDHVAEDLRVLMSKAAERQGKPKI